MSMPKRGRPNRSDSLKVVYLHTETHKLWMENKLQYFGDKSNNDFALWLIAKHKELHKIQSISTPKNDDRPSPRARRRDDDTQQLVDGAVNELLYYNRSK